MFEPMQAEYMASHKNQGAPYSAGKTGVETKQMWIWSMASMWTDGKVCQLIGEGGCHGESALIAGA